MRCCRLREWHPLWLQGSCFDHTDGASSRDDVRHLELRCGEQIAEPRPGSYAAISASQYAEHQQVPSHHIPELEALSWLIADRHDPFDQQDFALLGDHFPTVPQWYDGSVVFPDDEEVREHVCIAAGGYGLERIASDETAAIAETPCSDGRLCGSQGPGQIKNDTGWPGISF